jgi:PAS domain S-box-containing protein
MNYTQLHPMMELDRTIAAFKNIVKHGKGSLQNGVIRRKDGTAAPVDITSTAIEYNGGKSIQASFRDISEHVQIEEKLDKLVRDRTVELSIARPHFG